MTTQAKQNRQLLYEALSNSFLLFCECEPYPQFYRLEDYDIRKALRRFIQQLSDHQVRQIPILYQNDYDDSEKVIPYVHQIPKELFEKLQDEIDEISQVIEQEIEEETKVRAEWEQYPRGWGD